MVLSFVYLAFVALLKLLLRGGRRVEVRDLELLVLRHQVDVLRRQIGSPALRPSDRRCFPAQPGGCLRRAATACSSRRRRCCAGTDSS
jgi:hypothetical protein